MKMCDWCGEAVPEKESNFINLRPESWPYSDCRNKYVQIQLHDECCGALIGILREGDQQRPAALDQKQRQLRSIFR